MPQINLPWNGSKAPTFAQIKNKPATFPATPATTTVAGGVIMQPRIAPLAAAPTQADFNNLLAALTASGVISAT
jgi:hypothetical protein